MFLLNDPNGKAVLGGVAGAVGAINNGIKNTSSSSKSSSTRRSSSSGSTKSTSNYGLQLDLIKRQAELQRAQKLNEVKSSLESILGTYNNNLNTSNQSYDQKLTSLSDSYNTGVNTNELNKYKSNIALREALANRGALNSGVGRQEVLNTQNAYNNNANSLLNNYNTNRTSLEQSKQSAQDNIKNQIASAINSSNNTYSDSISNLNNTILDKVGDAVADGYTPKSDYTVSDDSWTSYLNNLRKKHNL